MSIVNQRELSEIFGVSQVTLTEWQKEGMPMMAREANGLANQYDTAVVIEWCIMRRLEKAQVETPRDRLDRVRADREELELRIRLGKIADTTTIQPAIDEFFSDLGMELDGLANRYTDQMHATSDQADKFQLFRRIAREVRERLSAFEFRPGAVAEVDSEVEAEG